MWKPLAGFVAALVVVGAVVWALAMRTASEGPVAPPRVAPAPRPREVNEAVDRLRTLQLESAELMPDDARGVFIGMRRDELVRLRTNAAPAQGAPEGYALLQELLGNGAVVAYLVSPRLDRVVQVQFLSRLTSAAGLPAHYQRLVARYGEPAGFLECPTSAESAPTRRILWNRREASVMEAILVYQGQVSLTLAVAGKRDVLTALRRQGCQPVAREAAGRWPTATTLPGVGVPVR